MTGLVVDVMHGFKIVGYNVKGESEQSGILYQFSAQVPTQLHYPTLIAGTRTWSTVGIQMYMPGLSTTDVLGF